MKAHYVIGNWKMNKSPDETEAFCSEVVTSISELPSSVYAGIAPSDHCLISALRATGSGASTKQNVLHVGAQNAYFEKSGAFTGEIAAKSLHEIGCSFSICGHSERRSVFFENDELCAKRALGCITAGLLTIFCIGESLDEREAGKTPSVLKTQLLPLFTQLVSVTSPPKLLIAYEPVWAIGTGKVAEPDMIEDTHRIIRGLCEDHLPYGDKLGILYGGSVKPANYSEIAALDLVDGALVGGASLEASSFLELLAIAKGSVH